MTGLSKIALIVGEEGAMRLQLARWLSTFGIDSVHVDRSDDALALADRLEPDLVILSGSDRLPDLTGVVARAARRRNRPMRVMVCARDGNAAQLGAAVAEGADECLVAPFDADLLRFKLEQTGVLPAN